MTLQNPFLNCLEKFYSWIIRIGSHLQSLLLLYLRLTWGHQLFLAGLAKVSAIPLVESSFEALHIPFPLFHAYLVSNLELVAGFLLFIGFASRLAAIPVIFIMLAALGTAHAPELSEFRFLFEPLLLVRQAPYPFLLTAMAVLAFGPGRVSVDAWVKRWIAKQPRY